MIGSNYICKRFPPSSEASRSNNASQSDFSRKKRKIFLNKKIGFCVQRLGVKMAAGRWRQKMYKREQEVHIYRLLSVTCKRQVGGERDTKAIGRRTRRKVQPSGRKTCSSTAQSCRNADNRITAQGSRRACQTIFYPQYNIRRRCSVSRQSVIASKSRRSGYTLAGSLN